MQRVSSIVTRFYLQRHTRSLTARASAAASALGLGISDPVAREGASCTRWLDGRLKVEALSNDSLPSVHRRLCRN
jgi:hypothetical protein